MDTFFVLKLLLFINFLGANAKRDRKDAPADIALIDNTESSSVADPAVIPSLPDILHVNVTLLNQQNPILLKLKRNKLMDKKQSMFVIRRNTEGKPVLVRKNVGLESNIGYYQDRKNEASMKVKCEGLNEGVCYPVLSGSVGEYDIEPLKLDQLNTVTRKRRALLDRPAPGKQKPQRRPIRFRARINQNRGPVRTQQLPKQRKNPENMKREKRQKRLLYGVFKRKMKRMRRKDSMRRKKDQVINRPPNSALLKGAGMLKVVREINADNTPVEVLGKNLANKKVRTAPAAGGRAGVVIAKETYNVEILAVIDYQTYVRFLENQVNGTNDEKEDEAYKEIRQYFSQVVNGIDMRYGGINSRDYHIRVTLSNFVVLDNPDYPDWDSHKSTNEVLDEAGQGHYVLDVEQAILKLSEWRKDMISQSSLPEHDHLMMFSDHDLSSRGDVATSGFAFVGEICSPYSVSIIEDFGLYESILIGTHELGHSLGADHDGERNTCNSSDSFIMADISGNTNENTLYNPYVFSTCSKDAFKAYFGTLAAPGSGTSNDNCLLDEALIFDVMEFNAAIEIPPGQLFNPNQQCQDRLGPDSYYGWGGNLGEYSEVCHQMSCKSFDTKFSYNVYTALPGTTCGNKKWCVNGRCVQDERAPSSIPTCVHGDSQMKFENNETCAELISSFPAYCYDEYYSDFCCESCERTKSNKPNCPFKDRSTRCVGVFSKPNLCYKPQNLELCCDSCDKLDSGIEGCRFGDKQDDCDSQYCNLPGNEEYTASCCKTCASGNSGAENQGIGNQGTGTGQETGLVTGTQGTGQGTDTQGTGNQGTGNQGTGNQGTGNQGTGNQGTGTQGVGQGTDQGTQGTNQGTDTQGTGNQGTGNQGTENQGTGTQGTETQGPDQGTQGTGNQGTGNQGTENQGTGNQGTENQGTGTQGTDQGTQETGNQGTGNQGTGNQGTENQGTGNQGTENQGTGTDQGTQGTGNQGTGNQGTGSEGTGAQGTGQGTGTQGTGQGTGTQGTGQGTGTQGTSQGTDTQGTGSQGTGNQGTGSQGNEGTGQGTNNEEILPGIDNQGTVSQTQQGFCLKRGGRIGVFRCSVVAYMIPGLCTVQRFRGRCCERCSGCVDFARCTLRYSGECYDTEVQKGCCKSCKRYRTNKAECEYGDKNKACRTYVRYNYQFTCKYYRKTCCLSCDKPNPTRRTWKVSRSVAIRIKRILGEPDKSGPKVQGPPTISTSNTSTRQETKKERKKRLRKEKNQRKQRNRINRKMNHKLLRDRINLRRGRRRG